jgi:predicted transcriptional regulator
MTIKELAEFTGKTERAVRNWVKKATEKSSVIAEKSSVSSPMNPADYNVDEVELILNESRLGQNAVMIIMENARREKDTAIVDASSILSFMAQMQKQQQDFMTAVLEKLDKGSAIDSKQKMIEAPEPDFRSMLRQIIAKYAKEHTSGDMREAWGVLYEELYYRCKISVRTRANNAGMSKLDVIEEEGLLQKSYLIMIQMMGE